MFREFVPCRVAALALACAIAGSPVLVAEEARLAADTSLRSGPDSEEVRAFLTSGAPVEVLDRRDGWVRVRLDGWVREQTVAGSTAASPAVAAPQTVPLAAPAVPATPVTIEGLVRVKHKRSGKQPTAGMSVLLVPAEAGLDSRDSDPERLAELAAEAARLESEAQAAMHDSNFAVATRERDRLMDERARALSEWRDLIAADHGRREQAARRAAVASATADAKGWYTLAAPRPGSYTLYARLTEGTLDLEWIEPVAASGGTLRVDLDAKSAHGQTPRAD